MLSIFVLLSSFLVFFDRLFLVWFVPSFLGLLLVDFLKRFFARGVLRGLFLCDYFSMFMVFITFWVFLYCGFCLNNFFSFCFIWVMFLFLTLRFLIDSYLLFYLFFEVVFLFIFVFLLS